jgi:hypothetical protein
MVQVGFMSSIVLPDNSGAGPERMSEPLNKSESRSVGTAASFATRGIDGKVTVALLPSSVINTKPVGQFLSSVPGNKIGSESVRIRSFSVGSLEAACWAGALVQRHDPTAKIETTVSIAFISIPIKRSTQTGRQTI